MNTKEINKVSVAVFRSKKVLMARSLRNREVFYTLGGKIEPGESDESCMTREVMEEAAVKIIPGSINYLNEFHAEAHDKPNTIVKVRLYAAILEGTPIPSSEIAELAYFDSTIDEKHLTSLTRQIFAWLKDKGYIN